MSSPEKYPLDTVLSIKKKRFDQAMKTLEEKKAILEQAYEKLFNLSKERDETLEHRTTKLTQLRESLDTGAATDRIQQMRAYLKIVDQQLEEKEKKVAEQQKVVDQAQKQVDLATQDLFQKKKDLEKLEIHKDEWSAEMRQIVERKEASEQDEQGAATYEIRKKQARRNQRDDS